MFLKKKKKKKSDMSKEEINKEEELENTTDESTQEEPVVELSKEEQLEEQVKVLNDKHIRLYSEFENFRRRTAKEKIDLIGSASQRVILNFLPIMDDLKRANEVNKESNDAEAIKEGFGLIFEKFSKTLESTGVTKMDSKEEVFDAEKHEAITNIPAPTEKLKGKVVDVIEDGYYLNDKIIRFAKVVVGQ